MDNTKKEMPTQYRKKPVVVNAIKWTGDNLKDVINFTGLNISAQKWTWEEYEQIVKDCGLIIFSREGKMAAAVGDFIIKGVRGEHYPCCPEIFAETYELSSLPNREEKPAVSEYQNCPKCNGEGRVLNTGTSTSTHSLCDVCSGQKILVKPVVYRDVKESPLREEIPTYLEILNEKAKRSDKRLRIASYEPELLEASAKEYANLRIEQEVKKRSVEFAEWLENNCTDRMTPAGTDQSQCASKGKMFLIVKPESKYVRFEYVEKSYKELYNHYLKQ